MTRQSSWRPQYANGDSAQRVTVERIRFEDPPEPGDWTFCFVLRGDYDTGVFPGTESDEWIEVVW